jgi:hypothetical protein
MLKWMMQAMPSKVMTCKLETQRYGWKCTSDQAKCKVKLIFPKQPVDSPERQEHASANDETRSSSIVLTKVHIRGLDTLTSNDIRTYVKEHFGDVEKIEWIDDTSANLVFNTVYTAQDAILALSAIDIADPTQLPVLECLPAKPISSKPELNLQVRFAVVGDKKQAGAAARSRFYLLHPEYDPEERRREANNRNRYRDRHGDTRYHRGERGHREGWTDTDPSDTFDASLYDDDEETLAKRATRGRRSITPTHRDLESDSHDSSYRLQKQSKELFEGRRRGRKGPLERGRSASPVYRNESSNRDKRGNSKNRAAADSIKSRLVTDNRAKELFPSKLAAENKTQLGQADPATDAADFMGKTMVISNSSDDRDTQATSSHDLFSIRGMASQKGASSGFAIKGAAAASVKELFPNKFGSNAGKELFAEKLEGRGRRRQRAEDLFY